MRIIETQMDIFKPGTPDPDIKRPTFDVYNTHLRKNQGLGALKRAYGKAEISRFHLQREVAEDLCDDLVH